MRRDRLRSTVQQWMGMGLLGSPSEASEDLPLQSWRRAQVKKPMQPRKRHGLVDPDRKVIFILVAFLALLSPRCVVEAANNYYNDDGGNGYNDDKAADDAAAYYNNGDDANNKQQNRDDDYYLRNQKYDSNYYVNDDNNGYSNSAYYKEQQQYQNKDDDVFHWDSNVGFGGVRVMPISCINYNSGHMIKFQLFDSSQGYQCHFKELSTFVVSIAHYMRAYFNYEALTKGSNFQLPNDASLLNCIQIQGVQLYAKIGCMERETFTSTKLQLHVYTDSQCSQPYDDGQTARQHATKGYKIGEGMLDTRVSFRPPFYSCLSCAPETISDTFNKRSGTWYDDDFISKYNNKQNNNNNNNQANDDGNQYMAANDDVDDQYNRRLDFVSKDDVESFEEGFWEEVNREHSRRLYDNYYDIGNWNMCQRIYKYGMWCDADCRALDFFRTDQWSASDIFLLVIMCVFVTAMMLLVVAKRLKAQQKSRMYGEDQPMPGLPPIAMSIMFLVILATVITLAKLKFINETLVFAVVTCVLLFIYMLKLTLFENRRPVLLAAPRHEIFDQNPLDDHLFD